MELKRALHTIVRKVVKSIVCKSNNSPLLRPKMDNIMSLIGPPPFLYEPKDKLVPIEELFRPSQKKGQQGGGL